MLGIVVIVLIGVVVAVVAVQNTRRRTDELARRARTEVTLPGSDRSLTAGEFLWLARELKDAPSIGRLVIAEHEYPEAVVAEIVDAFDDLDPLLRQANEHRPHPNAVAVRDRLKAEIKADLNLHHRPTLIDFVLKDALAAAEAEISAA